MTGLGITADWKKCPRCVSLGIEHTVYLISTCSKNQEKYPSQYKCSSYHYFLEDGEVVETEFSFACELKL